MISIENIQKEFEELLQKINLQFGGLSKKEKNDLLFIADRFLNSIVALTIFDDESFKDNENEKDN